MALTIELSTQALHERDIQQAALITAAGFGRLADHNNYRDTEDHLRTADYLQLVRDGRTLFGFAAYRNLWRGNH